MSIDRTTRARAIQVIVVGNEKGGSGKSTVAMHIAVALLKAGRSVATIDMDARQKTFTTYIQNRQTWAQHVGRSLELPTHFCLEESANFPSTEERATASRELSDIVDTMMSANDYVVIDTAGHDSHLMRVAHSMADILVTPLNDSFVDFDVLGTVDPETFAVTDIGHYSRMVDEARSQRQLLGDQPIDWFVLRNRLSSLGSRNKRLVGEGLQQLAKRLDFHSVEGLAERVIFREFYPRGLTALDDLDEATLGTRPTMSHFTARFEVDTLLTAMGLSEPEESGEIADQARDAA